MYLVKVVSRELKATFKDGGSTHHARSPDARERKKGGSDDRRKLAVAGLLY